MMKNSLLLSIVCCLAGVLQAQSDGTAPHKYWVQFKDRAGSPYTLENATEFLSPQALQRRSVQGIALMENDLPVHPAYVNQVAATGAQPVPVVAVVAAGPARLDRAQLRRRAVA